MAHYIIELSKTTRTGPPNMESVQSLGKVEHQSLVDKAVKRVLIRVSSAKVEFASQLTYNLLITTARVSVIMLYYRIFSLANKYFMIAWWISMSLVLGVCTALLIQMGRQCSPRPISALWTDVTHCDFENRRPMILGFVNAIVDLYILLLPMRMVWMLQMSTKRKALVCGLFALGIM